MADYTLTTHRQLRPGIEQEWLLTNGRGGFTSGTVVGCNTRRYHAILCAATLPPLGRVVALNRIGEILTIDDKDVHEFSVNQFDATTFHPHGERYLHQFTLDDVATWEYDVAGVSVQKQVMLAWGRDVAAVRYRLDPQGLRARLELLPMVSIRDFHALLTGTGRKYTVRAGDSGVSVCGGGHTLHLRCDGARVESAPDWWKGHYYAVEAERGQDHLEDLYNPGRFVVDVAAPITVTIIASLEPIEAFDWDSEILRKSAAIDSNARTGSEPSISPRHRDLIRAARDFVVSRRFPDGSDGVTVIAGYPWFADWGRDTMICVPGLFLTTGRFDDAARVLGIFASYVSDGMIPNRFNDYTNEPEYNTVDASLWFIHACHEYLRASKDRATFETKLLPACRAIVDGYVRGTRFGIRMDPADGLITQGDPTTQLTWMDAKCGGTVFTPRQGKPVEINALWYNALVLMGNTALAKRVRDSFTRSFWISSDYGLYDVIDADRRDASVRPNQIFAVSLPNSPLDRDKQRAVVDVVRRELLTPYGLRTLAVSDPKFQQTFTGPQFERDRAYHNGTIWPWLIGAFLEAYLKVNDHSQDARQQARQWLAPLTESMHRLGCIGQIAEVFEARPPHRPAGCCAQAWSVAEALRLVAMLEM